MLVKDLMTSDVTTLRRNEKLTLADDVMHPGRVRHLARPSEDGQELVGILSQRDPFHGALTQALGYGRRGRRKLLDTLLVKDVMATEVVVTTPETPLAEAARADGAQIRVSSCSQRRPPCRHPDGERFRCLGCAQDRLERRFISSTSGGRAREMLPCTRCQNWPMLRRAPGLRGF